MLVHLNFFRFRVKDVGIPARYADEKSHLQQRAGRIMNTRSVRNAAGLVLAVCAGILVGLSAPTRAGDKGAKDRPMGKWTVTSMTERGRPLFPQPFSCWHGAC